MAVDVDAADRKLITVTGSGDRVEDDVTIDLDSERCDDETGKARTSYASDDTSETMSAGRRRLSTLTAGLVVVGAILVAVSALAGWYGYRTVQERRAEHTQELFLQAGRQAAINLTSIDYANADADIKRVLDASTGQFADEFARNSAGFAETVRQAHAKSTGKITASGVESVSGESAQVLVAVAVTTTAQGTDGQQPRLWRMRIALQKQGDDVKVANVGFVQ
jgi:Mce-associated membrane protein